MVAGYHLIWTAYGWWLPNDPRGSCSLDIRVEKLEPLGPMHYERKAGQPRSAELRRFYEAAGDLLAHPLLTFDDDDIELIGATFARVIEERRYTCYACAIMPDHVHLLIRKHRDKAEEMIEYLQQASREDIIRSGKRSVTHPVWGGPGWKVFLNTRRESEQEIKYIRQNPVKIGRPEQVWAFVKKYDGWLPGYRG